MKTRGRPNGETWPKPGPLLHQTQTIEGQSYTSALSAKEKSHFAECTLHFGTIPSFSWECRAWSQHSIQKHPHPHSLQARCAATLLCGNRCGRPFLRTDARDQQWYCSGHDVLLAERRPRLLEVPGEIRNEIYKHAFPPFLGLFPQRSLDGSSIRLLEANKQVYKEVISLMYGTKPLRLRYEQDDLNLDTDFYDWSRQRHRIRCCQERDDGVSALLRFLGRNAFDYVRDIEIYVDLEGSRPAKRSILRDFADALCAERRTRQRRLTIKFTAATLTGEEEEVDFFRFLQALRGVPEFKDLIFEVADLGQRLSQRKGEIKHLVQRASAMRDSLLQGQKRKWERIE